VASLKSVDAPGFYERAGLNVETYDLRTEAAVAGVLQNDVEFYLEQAAVAGGPVLDLGGGTGRVALPLARAGYEVTLVDRSDAMLRRADEKLTELPPDVGGRVRIVNGDIADFELRNEYGLAIAPFRAFQALLTPAAQRSCVRSVQRHLVPGGWFVVQLFDPLLQTLVAEPGAPPNPDRGTVRHPKTGNEVRIRVLERRTDPLRDKSWTSAGSSRSSIPRGELRATRRRSSRCAGRTGTRCGTCSSWAGSTSRPSTATSGVPRRRTGASRSGSRVSPQPRGGRWSRCSIRP
jgi:ubiquinone/menaquinone biosynthesis C-methylase UbiE